MRRRWVLVGTSVLVLAAGVYGVYRWRTAGPDLATAQVTRGDYVDTVEIRGQIRPLRSILVTAPMQAGELQILKLSPNGSAVKAGDMVLQFDGATLQRTIQERESELRQALEELDQAKAQANITTEQDSTALLHSRYDVDRAKLGLGTGDGDTEVLSRIDGEKAKLTLADAQQRLRESEVKSGANRDSHASGFTTQESKIAKVRADLDRARRSLAALEVKAPADGVVSILPNYRASSPMGSQQEFRAGDRAWAGAQVLELPDLSSVHLSARLDESDRGRLQPSQAATIKVDAIPDRDYQAQVTDLSVLARVDFSSWPPVKQFDLRLTFNEPDAKLRPGMSAMARIVVGRLPDMTLVPPQTIFLVDGRAVVYRLEGRRFVPVIVEVIKRSKEQAAVKGGIQPGDRVALTQPEDRAKAGQ